MDNSSLNICPICSRNFSEQEINDHVDKCLFLHSNETAGNVSNTPKRDITLHPKELHLLKKPKLESSSQNVPCRSRSSDNFLKITKENIPQPQKPSPSESIPLAENMRPNSLEEYVGQNHVLGKDKILRQLLLKKDIPSMILWGPPGCGKTSLANVISNICKEDNNMRFVKLSATMSGINDVKEVVKVAKNEAKFKRKTVLFMDEIHRFNKLQQDTFLPHVENGTLVLIGATTENPSFSLNSALLSRCQVIVLEKLTTKDVLSIILRAVETKYKVLVMGEDTTANKKSSQDVPRLIIELQTLNWLAEICDGDARVALSSLQLSVQAKDPGDEFETSGPTVVSLEDIKDGIKRSHLLYDRKGDEHYNMISALHKSIRASDDNAALYWLTRMLEGGEDPIYIARRMVRIAGEDIGIADLKALNMTVACMQGCQLLGMPECDVLLAQCAVYLARTDKSTEVYQALNKCKRSISEHKGPLPSVPLHLRNAPTKLMAQLGHGQGYNTRHKDDSNLSYMPEGMENADFLE